MTFRTRCLGVSVCQLDALLSCVSASTLTLVFSSFSPPCALIHPFILFFFSLITSSSLPPLSCLTPPLYFIPSSFHLSFSTSFSSSHPSPPPLPLFILPLSTPSPLSQVRSVGASLISPRRRREVSNDRH